MKIIHCADLHLGSKFTSLPVGNVREKRKGEILKSFNRLIDYARKNDIKHILLSGDVFDSDRPSKKDKMFFYDAISANSNITFLYLRGNHDIEESIEKKCDNLLLFDDSWKSYSFGNVVISGIELSASNNTSLYSSLLLDKEKLNIVMMHGDINSKGKDFIDIKKLANKNIDYLALGHIHKFSEFKIDDRGIAIYPGCLEGRGFDELGEKGFVVLNIDEKVHYEFVPFSSRVISEKRIDISSAKNLYEAKSIVQSEIQNIQKNTILKIILTGKVDFDINGVEKDIQSFLNDKLFYFKVENELQSAINIDKYKNDLSLKGEFVRNILSNNELSDSEKEEMLSIGIKLLNGEEIE